MPRNVLTDNDLTDEDIARLITEALAWDTRIHYPHIRVNVDGGVVFLSGIVECMVEKVAAEEDSSRIAGVTQVISNIAVQPQNPVKDESITESVKDALRRDARTTHMNFEVASNNGVVTIRGEVMTAAEKRSVVDIANLTYGVEGVIDHISILPEQQTSDHMLEELINATLIRSIELDEKKIHPHVQDGIVHLLGVTDFLYQRSKAEQVVEDVPGVRGVVNELVVSND
ncbi:MAG: BON domain-containing protein [Armatimonadota bacterium]